MVNVDSVVGFELAPKVMGKVLLNSENVTVVKVVVEPGGSVPDHSHPHEQMGILLTGKAQFHASGKKLPIEAGMAYWIKPNEIHGVTVEGDEPSIFIDIFYPSRTEYVEKQRNLQGQLHG